MGANKLPKDKLTKNIDMLARMEANGASRAERMEKIFGLDVNTATDRELNNADSCMSRWRKHPMFDQAWKDEARKWDYEDYVLAREVFRKGMKQDKDGWLAMNSAVNALSSAGKRLFHDEDTAVTVKIEGLPDLGSPDQEE
jgi:hypothetical protein